MEVARVTAITLSYIDKLQRANADDLAFYPLTTLEKARRMGAAANTRR